MGLSVIEYPEWLANVVPIPKNDGKDMQKTYFITEWVTYCYKVMLSGLKNAEATYQRATTTFFHDMMHQDVEAYVDDMIVKSRDRVDHRKLLGYMVSEKGIKADPNKIRVVLEMPASRIEREIEISWICLFAFSDRHPAMNNIVEYEACILGLETTLDLGIRQMEVFSDSNLVLRQIQGHWKTRDVKLRPYHAYLGYW
ncbi:hypothetical protein CK203_109671 [Vitis vinifera]|uniref:RNase H type-1 domain-containing protein n=1 Tax=Vitis vinifera TaxID=29760 RepID=A0A438CF79_VITVI|nr:hypothetical protein CK203_109671 [Vitis vinifera]